jgi:2-oxoglutarate dehydrogenase dihydrolipoamide succinyltransferase (E2 component)
MPTKVLMPQLGESVDEGTLSKWLKSEGDHVDEYEPLLEVNTDKVDSEIPSPAEGVLLKILVSEGTTIEAGTLLAWIGEQGEAVSTEPQAPSEEIVAEAQKPQPAPATEAVPAAEKKEAGPPRAAAREVIAKAPPPGRDRELGFISPVVARIASEENVDLYQVEGTGQGGRITKKDVLSYLEKRAQGKPVQPAAAPTPAPTPGPAPAKTLAAVPSPAPGEVIPLDPVRKAIADHMVLSKHTSPHVTTVMEVDLKRVVEHRQANKQAFARDGVKLTFTAYFVSAVVAALREYPIVNSSWSDEGIRIHRQINIGMATSMGEAGLIVPVIKNADTLSLLGLASAINDLATRARSRQLKPDEVKGGTFTITNHGTSGSLFATPIINQPQCAILGVGVIQKRVVVIEDAIAIRPMAYLTLTFDHRILDGAIADYFLAKVVEYLQNWQS